MEGDPKRDSLSFNFKWYGTQKRPIDKSLERVFPHGLTQSQKCQAFSIYRLVSFLLRGCLGEFHLPLNFLHC